VLFSSLVFLWIFLPVVFIGTRLLAPKRGQWANTFLLIASLIFYAWGEPKYIVLMLLSITINYVSGIALESVSVNKAKQLIVAACVLITLLLQL